MSDDWQVVEEAFQAVLDSYAHGDDRYRDRWIADVREGIARLREREAQLEAERDYFRSRLPDFSAVQLAAFARAEAVEARVKELEELLGEDAGAAWFNLNARVKELEDALREKPDQPLLNAARKLVLATDNAARNYALADLVSALAQDEALS